MRIIWEEEDIKCGMKIIRSCCTDVAHNISYASTVSYVIGYASIRPPKTADNPRPKLQSRIGMMNFLADGGIRLLQSKRVLMEELNNDEHGYRVLTNKEINLMLQED